MPSLSSSYFSLKQNRTTYVALLIFASVLLLAQCVTKVKSTDLRGETYAGSDECQKCHQEIYNAYSQTAHFATSSNKLPGEVKAGFAPGKNKFRFNDSVEVVMEKVDSQFYQSYYLNGKKQFTHPFDITIGSGRKAQTYLYYNTDGKIAQLPLSYFIREHTWANSPGFPSTAAKFDRIVPSNCLGCHSSFIGVKQTYKGLVLQEEFERNKLVYGIDCERCHGPAKAHVDYFTEHPGGNKNTLLKKINFLTRVQKNDMCGLCHSGFRAVQQPLFQYNPGDDLSNFFAPEFGHTDIVNLDVHGNQSQLMMASKCYQLTDDLTCNSCHNVHDKERDNLSLFSKRCTSCHTEVNHSFSGTDKRADQLLQSNCIDCHMPLKASRLITLLTDQKISAHPDYIRNHLIAIYPGETRKVLNAFRQSH